MMNNLFSIFDPSNFVNSLAWSIIFMPLFLMKKNKNTTQNNFKKMKMMVMVKIINETKEKMSKKLMKNSEMMMNEVFMLIMLINMWAIVSFNFTSSAQMVMSMPLSMTLWLSVMLWGWMKNQKNMMVHLTPLGTPNQLMNFMVLIESTSIMIRPITLSIRLTANMVAGHLLMSLLSSFSMAGKFNTMATILIMGSLIMLETIVAMVQAYVVITLIVLYQNESI